MYPLTLHSMCFSEGGLQLVNDDDWMVENEPSWMNEEDYKEGL